MRLGWKLVALLVMAAAALVMAAPDAALAAEEAHGVNGAQLGLAWGIPFVGMLLSIALFPLLLPHFWHHHYGKVTAFWALVFLVPYATTFGVGVAASDLVHTALKEYIPFIILLFGLFTISGGLVVTGNIHGSPKMNTGLLAIGTLLASVIGTTGASMVLIRPLLRANDERRHRVHTVVFFIFLVSNIGGSMSPLGDPPLFLGFLQGVDFFWTTVHISPETLLISVVLLGAFFLLDSALYARDENMPPLPDPTPDTSRVALIGLVNLPLLVGVVAAILMSGIWQSGINLHVFGTDVALEAALRDIIILVLALVSIALTPRALRERNGFEWEPIIEVAKLFAGIFLTIIPVIAILRAGEAGAGAGLVRLVTDSTGEPIPAAYFWITGMLSSVLDNAPTYLVFFNLAGGDAQNLMTEGAHVLSAISAGAVFMGALTYIGNAPNFMVLSIAKNRGVKMPTFFGYMLWSYAFLVPCFALATLLFYWG